MRAGSGHARSRPGRTGRGAATARRQGSAVRPEEHERLERVAGPVVRAGGMDLESLQVTPAGRRRVLKVVVDADGGVGLDDMAEISRALSTELDSSGAMGDTPYTLEVSSPGVERPLTEPRHWRRAAGRLVSVPVAAHDPAQRAAHEPAHEPAPDPGQSAPDPGQSAPDPGQSAPDPGRGSRGAGRILHGRVVTAGDDGVVLNIDDEHRTFGYNELGPGRIELEFGRGDRGERDGH